MENEARALEEAKKAFYAGMNTPKEKSHQDEQSAETSQSKIISIVRKFDTEFKIPPREFIGGIFPRRYLSIIGGAPGLGKSWYVGKTTGDLSIGGEIFGGVGFEYQPRKSLVLAGELGADGMIERARAANIEVNKENAFIIDQLDAEEKDIVLTLNTQDGKNNITELVKILKPDILFVDSLISFFSGDENKNSEVAEALKFLLKLARTQNIAVVAIHHIRKRLANEQNKPLVLDDVIGSSAINRLTAVVIGMEYNRDIDAVKVSCLKSWFKYFKPFSFKMKSMLYGHVKIEINTDLKEEATLNDIVKSAAQPDTKTAILLFLKGRGESGASIQEINDAINGNANTTKQQLRRMADNGEIKKLNRGIYAANIAEIPTNSETKNEKKEENNISISF